MLKYLELKDYIMRKEYAIVDMITNCNYYVCLGKKIFYVSGLFISSTGKKDEDYQEEDIDLNTLPVYGWEKVEQ
jgi:hypothetical protein